MMQWLLPGNRANKIKAQRRANALVKAKAAEKTLQGKLKLTRAGEKALENVSDTP
jgi:hypothetical protein